MNDIKVLIVEDEAIVAHEMGRAIEKIGFKVTAKASNFKEALASMDQEEPSIIIMDINLENSDKDGIEIAEYIQKVKQIPVIFLTAYSDDETIQRAIAVNPVTYLIKPYNPEELKSNILIGVNQYKRRLVNIENTSVELNFGYSYDVVNENLYHNGEPVRLGGNERILLTLLVEAKGELVPSSIIEYYIWPDGPKSESALRTLIYRLRSKLTHNIIETTASFGCKLLVEKN